MSWYVMLDSGAVIGPLSGSEIRRMELNRDTLVSHNRSKWIPLHKARLDEVEMPVPAQEATKAAEQGVAGFASVAGWLGIVFVLLGAATHAVIGILLGIWFLATWAGAHLGAACGMERGKGAVLGFLLGPLGLLIIVVAWAVRSDGTNSRDRV